MIASPGRGLTAALLVAIVLAGGALRAARAEHPTRSYQSADERSYGKLALGLAERHAYGDARTGLRDPLHWPPGAPALFALAHQISSNPSSDRTADIPSAYWAQAVVGTATILAAFGLAALLAGSVAGLVAALLVALYPPLIQATGDQLSEPFGALLLTSGFATLAWAWRRQAPARFALGGLLLGAAVLVRADLVLAPFLVAGLVALALREARWSAVALAGGALVAILPWSIYASQRAGELVPVTQGSAAALFVGTYLPGDGTTVGLKRDLGDATRHRDERLHAIPDLQLEAAAVLDTVAARDPGRSRRAALNHEARRNLRRYGLGDPLAFAAMMSRKAGRMWLNYARGGPRHNSGAVQALHVVLVLTGLAGLLAGLWRRRDPVLGAILAVVVYSTLLHTLVVSQARYNLPLMPALVAGGVAGAVLAARSGSRSRSSR